MSYEILGSKGQYWTCQQGAWSDYLKVATAFGWAPEGAFFRDDVRGFGPHDSGSKLSRSVLSPWDKSASLIGNILVRPPALHQPSASRQWRGDVMSDWVQAL